MIDREPGWYWCKDGYGDYLPLYWDGEAFLTSSDYAQDQKYYKKVLSVGPRVPTPDEMEGWQLVPVEPAVKYDQ